MTDETDTLLGLVRRHPERPVLICNDEPFTPSALCRAAEDLRGTLPGTASGGIALQFPNAGDLLIRLLALDGYAREILLLPPCLSGPPLRQLMSAANISHLLDSQGLSSVVPKRTPDSGDKNTKWLFTTSGTTGTPKVYSHTLRSLMATTRKTAVPGREYRWGLAYQAHRFAGMQVILQALASGSPLVVPPTMDPVAMVGCFARHRVNTLSATPSQWRKLLGHGAIRDCSLEQITLGGEIADQAILTALRRDFPAARIVHIYASTEAGVGFSVPDGQAGFPADWLGEGPPVDMKISESGSLLIRSPALSHSASLRQRLTPDGYLDTEDSVQVTDNRVHFLGRASGIINVGGNKVHPEEVENLVRTIPGVENALVSARKSPIVGQLVALEVQAGTLTMEEPGELKRRIREHCRRHLPNYKIPALITVVADLAVAESGKVERNQTG